MSEGFSYAVLGRGRWAGVIGRILDEQGRRTIGLGNVRRESGEPVSEYRGRLSQELTRSAAQIAWLCVPPGPHVSVMIDAALEAHVHAIVEKPWLGSKDEAERLSSVAKEKHVQIGFDYEYCLLHEIERWRRELGGGIDMLFTGCFSVSRPNRLGIDALENLGSHLAAIHAYAVPMAKVIELRCAYDTENRREVRLERDGQTVASLNFQEAQEPLIPKFIDRFESRIARRDFLLDLDFAVRVSETLAGYKRSRQISSSPFRPFP